MKFSVFGLLLSVHTMTMMMIMMMIGQSEAWVSYDLLASAAAKKKNHQPNRCHPSKMISNKLQQQQQQQQPQGRRAQSTCLRYSNEENIDNNPSSIVERIVISGVSVSRKGFHVLFQTRKGILPLPITKDPQDSYRASSPEALTILQLLSSIDMAGAVLPPETLAAMAIVQSEEAYYTNKKKNNREKKEEEEVKDNNKSNGDLLAEYVQTILPKDCPSHNYKDASQWFQHRMTLPQITLDQVLMQYDPASNTMVDCKLTCALPKNVLLNDSDDGSSKDDDDDDATTTLLPASSSFVVSVTPAFVESFAFQYNPETSHIFTSLALALRYKAPIVLQAISTTNNEDNNVNDVRQQQQQQQQQQDYYYSPSLLAQDFPDRTSIQTLHQQSSRISQNIETGFQVNQLLGALRIAKRLGDEAAIQKIQDKLDEYDDDDNNNNNNTISTMDDSPVVVAGEETKKNQSDIDKDEDEHMNDDYKVDEMDFLSEVEMLREEEEDGIIADDSDSNSFQ